MADDLTKKIKDDLEKSGFPAEVAVALELEVAKWMVYNGALFSDTEGKKAREIDIHAVHVDFSYTKEVRDEENKLISHLTIEVKKSNKPWVFFNNGRIDWPGIPDQNFKTSDENFSGWFEDLRSYGLKRHRYLNGRLHKSFHIAFSNPSELSVIYEALIKTSKALNYFKSKYGIGGYVLHLLTPVVVLDGTLWSASLDKLGNLNIEEVETLSVTFSQLIPEGNSEFEEVQLIDIVTLKYFKDYLHKLELDNKNIYKAWTNYIKSKENKQK